MTNGFHKLRRILLLSAVVCAFEARAEYTASSGRGGPFIELHFKSLAAFDPTLSGNAIVIGGKGVGIAGRNFRLGGAGGAGFAWGANNDVSYGMGYGGVFAEFQLTSWLSAGMIVGGGGFNIGRITSQTSTTTTIQKIAGGGFVLFYPTVQAEVKLRNALSLQASVGYFLPTSTELHSMTVGLSLLLGKI